jgi:hypothetical protein
VFDAFGRFSQGVVDRIFNAAGGRANQFDFLVGVMVRHGVLLLGVKYSLAVNLCLTSVARSDMEVQIYCTFSNR